jgi:hypothetical protein
LATYDLAFAQRFAEVAEATVARGIEDVEGRRVVAYISRVSMELSLKAFLELAGLPVSDIKKHRHNLRTLLAEVDQCEVGIEISPGVGKWLSASRLRAVDVGFLGYSTTVGAILEAENHGASVYPNELRYGAIPKDFPAEALAKSALAISKWVEIHWNSARRQ